MPKHEGLFGEVMVFIIYCFFVYLMFTGFSGVRTLMDIVRQHHVG